MAASFRTQLGSTPRLFGSGFALVLLAVLAAGPACLPSSEPGNDQTLPTGDGLLTESLVPAPQTASELLPSSTPPEVVAAVDQALVSDGGMSLTPEDLVLADPPPFGAVLETVAPGFSFDFNEGSGPAFQDDFGRAEGEVHDAGWFEEQDVSGLDFTAMTSSSVLLPTLELSAFTLEVRLRHHNNSDHWGGIVFLPVEGCAEPYQVFGLQLLSDGKLNFALGLDGRSVDLASSTSLVPERWYEVRAVFDGRSMALFLNGELTSWRPAKGTLAETTSPLLLGRTGCGEYFSGSLDKVALRPEAEELSWLEQTSQQPTVPPNEPTPLPSREEALLHIQANGAAVTNPFIVPAGVLGPYAVAVAGRRLPELALKHTLIPVNPPASGTFQLVAEFVSPLDPSDYYQGKYTNARQAGLNINDESNDLLTGERFSTTYLGNHDLPRTAVGYLHNLKPGDTVSLPAAMQIDRDEGFVNTGLGYKSGACHTANVVFGLFSMLEAASNPTGVRFKGVNVAYHQGAYLSYALIPGVPHPGVTFYYPWLDLSFKLSAPPELRDLELTVKVLPVALQGVDYVLIAQLYSTAPLY